MHVTLLWLLSPLACSPGSQHCTAGARRRESPQLAIDRTKFKIAAGHYPLAAISVGMHPWQGPLQPGTTAARDRCSQGPLTAARRQQETVKARRRSNPPAGFAVIDRRLQQFYVPSAPVSLARRPREDLLQVARNSCRLPGGLNPLQGSVVVGGRLLQFT